MLLLPFVLVPQSLLSVLNLSSYKAHFYFIDLISLIVGHMCPQMGNALHFFIFFYDFENSNIAECQVTNRFFIFVAETPKILREMHPRFSHRP